jgi:hypothetical protein
MPTTKKRRLSDRLITVTDRVEVYVDLYGLSVKWADTIIDKLLDMSRLRSADDSEGYRAFEAGGVGVRFITDADYAKKVRAKAASLINLAAKTYDKNSLYSNV